MLHRPDEDDLEHGSEHEGDGERRGERLPIGQPPLDELPGDVGCRHRELALGEVDDAGRAVDEDECKGEAPVDRADREPLHGQLGEDLAAQAADEKRGCAGNEEQADRWDRAPAAKALEPGSRRRHHQYPR